APSTDYPLSLHDALPSCVRRIEHMIGRIAPLHHDLRIEPVFLQIVAVREERARQVQDVGNSLSAYVLAFVRVAPTENQRQFVRRSEEHTSEVQSRENLVC